MDQYIADLLAESAENEETHLDLAGLGLTAVPEGVTDLVSLTHLSLRGNEIEEIPAEIGNLTQLTQLSLADNRLMTLPEEIGLLHQLKSLNLKNNRLTELPLGLLDLSGLARLQLSGNLLEIPADLIAKYDRPQEILAYYRTHFVVVPPPPPRPFAELVAEAFNEADLIDLVNELCVPEDEIEAADHQMRAQMLIDYHERIGLFEGFVELLQTLRPGRF